MMAKLIQLFSRVTSGNSVLLEIDGLRFVAIMGVLLYHLDGQMWGECPEALKSDRLSHWIHAVCNRGNFGVPLFFGISAFILALPVFRFARKGGSLADFDFKQYFIRRITRIEPPYVLCMLAMFVAYVAADKKDVVELGKRLLASLLYIHNLVYNEPSKVNGVAWSLEVEVQFYAIAPLLVFLLVRLGNLARRILLCAVIALLCLLQGFVVGFSLLTTFQFFGVGILVADLYSDTWQTTEAKGVTMDLGVILAALMVVFSPGDHAVGFEAILTKGLWVGAVLLLLLGALRGRYFSRILRWPLVYLTGGMCYTIYLWHSAYWRRVWRWATGRVVDRYYPEYLAIYGSLFLVLILVSCALIFLVLEKPFMRRDWPQRLWNRLKWDRHSQVRPSA